MKRHLVVGLIMAAALALPAAASAQSGHFVTGGANAPTCTDIGLQVRCSGKVAGLGGTTFEITVEAKGIASVVCINHGGNRAPGQDTSVTVSGTTTPLPTPRNGQYLFTVTTDSPDPLPATPTCPNALWTPVITDVRFTDATLTLLEDDVVSDVVTLPVT
jgi:hypothetical protein